MYTNVAIIVMLMQFRNVLSRIINQLRSILLKLHNYGGSLICFQLFLISFIPSGESYLF